MFCKQQSLDVSKFSDMQNEQISLECCNLSDILATNGLNAIGIPHGCSVANETITIVHLLMTGIFVIRKMENSTNFY